MIEEYANVAQFKTKSMSADTSPSKKLKWRIRLSLLCSAVFVAATIIVCYNHVIEEWRDNYRAAWVADLVIDFLRMNDRWPKDWSELYPAYEGKIKRQGQPWSFEELQQRVCLKFDVQPGDLDTGYISLKSGAIPGLRGQHPDEKIKNFIIRSSEMKLQKEKVK